MTGKKMYDMARSGLLILLLVSPGAFAEAPPSKWDRGLRNYPPVEGADNAFNITYTPADRCRTVGGVEDRVVQMNIHWPKPEGRYPCIVLFHGGGGGGGDKDVAHNGKAWKQFLAGARSPRVGPTR